MSSLIKDYPKGTILALQGEPCDSYFLLHTGALEILHASDEYNGLDQSLIVSHSKRVSLVEEKSFINGMMGKTVRAVSDCKVETLKLGQTGLKKLSRIDPVRTMMILSYLFRRTETSYSDLVRISKFYTKLEMFYDNVLILFRELSGREFSNDLEEEVNQLHQLMTENGGQIPQSITASFLGNDNSSFLNKNYKLDNVEFTSFYDRKLYDHFKRFFKLNRTVVAHVIKGDPEIPFYMHQSVCDAYFALLKRIYEITCLIDQKMFLLFGEKDSVSSVLVDEGALNDFISSGRLNEKFFENFLIVLKKFYASYGDNCGKESLGKLSGLEKLEKYIHSNDLNSAGNAVESEADGDSAPVQGQNQVNQLYNNSLNQIMQFAGVDVEFKKEFLTALNNFKRMTNPFTTEQDGRKVRRSLSKLYWELYEKVYVKTKHNKSVPAPAKLMLLFGFLDENLVDPEQIPVLHRLSMDKYRPGTPIVYEYEFLSMIYGNKEEPSMNEMGLTFDKQLREMSKSTRKGEDPQEKAKDPAYRVNYEVDNMLQSTTSVCSGSRSTAFPIMTANLLKGDPNGFVVTKAKLEKVFKELIENDYSAFYRETVFKIGDSREIIEEEVWPYIILLPTYGTKTMMWQEIVGTNKRSRARLVVPIHFIGDLKRELSHSLAVFRWELNRTLKGGLWADPVEGGITGAYSDYMQFYKKNSKLSAEAKQKIAEKFRSARSNVREMFAEDYILWLTYEREGIMKLNAVVRDMFYRFIPFRGDIRETLERMPAFSDSATRFKNIRNRTFAGFERKFRKYKDDSDHYPPEIEKYLKYLQM